MYKWALLIAGVTGGYLVYRSIKEGAEDVTERTEDLAQSAIEETKDLVKEELEDFEKFVSKEVDDAPGTVLDALRRRSPPWLAGGEWGLADETASAVEIAERELEMLSQMTQEERDAYFKWKEEEVYRMRMEVWERWT